MVQNLPFQIDQIYSFLLNLTHSQTGSSGLTEHPGIVVLSQVNIRFLMKMATKEAHEGISSMFECSHFLGPTGCKKAYAQQRKCVYWMLEVEKLRLDAIAYAAQFLHRPLEGLCNIFNVEGTTANTFLHQTRRDHGRANNVTYSRVGERDQSNPGLYEP